MYLIIFYVQIYVCSVFRLLKKKCSYWTYYVKVEVLVLHA